MTKSKIGIAVLVVLAYTGIFLIFYLWNVPIEYLKDLTKTGSFIAPIFFVLLAFLAVVVAPITVLPFLPVVSVLFGPFWAGTYILLGWTLGTMVAFYIARQFGKPVLKKLVSLESIEKYEDRVPKEMEFWWVLALRFILQVDVLSYAFGLFSRISLTKFTIATFLAFAPTAYTVSYVGEAFFMRDFKTVLILSTVFAIIFLSISYLFYRKDKA